MIQHTNDVGRFVGHNGFGFLVIKSGDGEATAIVGIDVEVDVAKMGEVRVDGIFGNILAW